MNLYIAEHEGTLYRKTTTKFVVSRWYIPGGCEYDLAKNVHVFFDTEESAKAYAKEYEMPPEMADAYPIGRYEDIIANCSRGYGEYKRRHKADFKEGHQL
jgi:hypothetical protein